MMPHSLSTIYYIWRSARPWVSAIAAVLALAVTCFYNGSIDAWQGLRVIPIALVTMVGFLANDIYDRKKDVLSGAQRPIALGKLRPLSAILALITLASLALMLEMYLGDLRTNICLLATLSAVLLYSPIAARAPLLKEVYTAGLCVMPLVYGAAISGSAIPAPPYFIIAAFVIGRELILNVMDLDGDLAVGLRTIPSYLGKRTSTFSGWLLMIASSSLLALTPSSEIMRLLGVLTVSMLLLCFILYRTNSRAAMTMTRIPMLTGAIIVASLIA